MAPRHILNVCTGILRRRFRARVARELRHGHIARERGIERLPGYGVDMSYPDRLIWLYQMKEIFEDDCYGINKLQADARVIDAGANIGAFSVCVLWRRPSARVAAIEPSPANLEHLRRNLAPFGTRAEIHEVALAETCGRGMLGGNTSDSLRTEIAGDTRVDYVALAEFLREPVDLLKMDIEGAEIETIRGAVPLLHHVRRAVIEYHDYREKPSRLLDLLALLQTGGLERFEIRENREFAWDDAHSPVHCCLVEAWQVR